MSAANPKFKVGDILQIGTTDPQEYIVLRFQTVDGILQYVLQWPGGGEQGIDVDFVDANPDWHLKTTPPPGGAFPWMWVAVGGAVVALGVAGFVMMRRRQ